METVNIDGVTLRKGWNWSGWYAAGLRTQLKASADAGDDHRAQCYLAWLAKERGLEVSGGGRMEWDTAKAGPPAERYRPRAMVWGRGESEIRLEIPNWDHVPTVTHDIATDDRGMVRVGTLDAREAYRDAGVTAPKEKRRAVVTAAQLRAVLRGVMDGEERALQEARAILGERRAA